MIQPYGSKDLVSSSLLLRFLIIVSIVWMLFFVNVDRRRLKLIVVPLEGGAGFGHQDQNRKHEDITTSTFCAISPCHTQVIASAEEEVHTLLPQVKETEEFMQLLGREYLVFDVSLQRAQVDCFLRYSSPSPPGRASTNVI